MDCLEAADVPFAAGLVADTYPVESSEPRVIGLGLLAAHELCREAGFTCRTVERDAPDVKDVGEVFDQRPPAGRVELELTQMTLYVGR
jgi:hypothetical protein